MCKTEALPVSPLSWNRHRPQVMTELLLASERGVGGHHTWTLLFSRHPTVETELKLPQIDIGAAYVV